MNNSEIRFKFYSPSTKFYGRMYGNEFIIIVKNGEMIKELDKIIEIPKEKIHFCKNDECFWYQWGWPGPDVNLYYFKDYGITWAFDKNDFINKEKEEVK